MELRLTEALEHVEVKGRGKPLEDFAEDFAQDFEGSVDGVALPTHAGVESQWFE